MRCVGTGPRTGDVLSEGDAPGVERSERAHLASPPQLCGEVHGVALAIERPSSVAPALAPSRPPTHRTVAEGSLFDLHLAPRSQVVVLNAAASEYSWGCAECRDRRDRAPRSPAEPERRPPRRPAPLRRPMRRARRRRTRLSEWRSRASAWDHQARSLRRNSIRLGRSQLAAPRSSGSRGRRRRLTRPRPR